MSVGRLPIRRPGIFSYGSSWVTVAIIGTGSVSIDFMESTCAWGMAVHCPVILIIIEKILGVNLGLDGKCSDSVRAKRQKSDRAASGIVRIYPDTVRVERKIPR